MGEVSEGDKIMISLRSQANNMKAQGYTYEEINLHFNTRIVMAARSIFKAVVEKDVRKFSESQCAVLIECYKIFCYYNVFKDSVFTPESLDEEAKHWEFAGKWSVAKVRRMVAVLEKLSDIQISGKPFVVVDLDTFTPPTIPERIHHLIYK